MRQTAILMRATAARTPHFGCFGMHEWAMVYRLRPEQVRHAAWPLRLGCGDLGEPLGRRRGPLRGDQARAGPGG